MYQEIEGNLITLALKGMFDVIAHGCNCFCTMKAGIAPQMAQQFFCDRWPMEQPHRRGDITKLGNIDWDHIYDGLFVVNAYTQYGFKERNNLDYEALTLCMRKLNHKFKNCHIGLPRIGAGLAGGDWERIKQIIQTELKDCDVTVVNYKKD